jgi:hypothetical protein
MNLINRGPDVFFRSRADDIFRSRPEVFFRSGSASLELPRSKVELVDVGLALAPALDREEVVTF